MELISGTRIFFGLGVRPFRVVNICGVETPKAYSPSEYTLSIGTIGLHENFFL